jgi:hypothetical protein
MLQIIIVLKKIIQFGYINTGNFCLNHSKSLALLGLAVNFGRGSAEDKEISFSIK